MVFLAGIIDAVAGGGGLITLPVYMMVGLPAHMAIGTNKLSSCMGTAMSTFKFAKAGFIPLKEALFCIIFAFIGSTLGANIALLIDERSFKIVMLIILPVIAYFVLGRKVLDVERQPYPLTKTIIIACLAAFAIGAYDGFYGPGTGTFLILLLTAAAHIDIRRANGITKAINLTSNISALVVYLRSGNTLLLLGLTAGLFGIAGNYIGARFFEKQGARAMKPIMIIVLAVFFVKLIVELL